MKQLERNNPAFSTINIVIYVIFFISLFFSLRAISSIGIGVLLAVGIVKQRGHLLSTIMNSEARWLVACGLLFTLLQLISLLYADNTPGVLSDVVRKAGLTMIPLAVILTGPFGPKTRNTIITGYLATLFAASVYCLVNAFISYGNTGDSEVLFFHQLVGPLKQHAVYFSIYVFVGLVWLLELMKKKIFPTGRAGSIFFIAFFSVFLFMLSSRLVFVFYIIYLLYFLGSLGKMNLSRKLIVLLIIFVIMIVSIISLTTNPIRQKFADISSDNLTLVKQDTFTPGDYFNGVQFRLLQWKFVPEILDKREAWWTGVGAVNAQPFLNEIYISKNMYLGDPALGTIGYRAYNSHNQLLESLLSYGIPGAVICLLFFMAQSGIILKRKEGATTFIILLLLTYALIESLFETQYGIVLFAFFPAFLCQTATPAANQLSQSSDSDIKI